MKKVINFLFKHWIRLLVALGIAIILFLIYMFVNGWSYKVNYMNATFVAGASLFFIGCLSLLANFGAFNIFSYLPMRRRKENGSRETYSEYNNRVEDTHKKDRFICVPYFEVGIIFLVVSLILMI